MLLSARGGCVENLSIWFPLRRRYQKKLDTGKKRRMNVDCRDFSDILVATVLVVMEQSCSQLVANSMVAV